MRIVRTLFTIAFIFASHALSAQQRDVHVAPPPTDAGPDDVSAGLPGSKAPTIVSPNSRATALRSQATEAFTQGDLEKADRLFSQALDAARVEGVLPHGIDLLRFDIALTALKRNERPRATQLLGDIFKTAYARGDISLAASVLGQRASMLQQDGRLDDARQAAQMSKELAARVGDREALANAARNLGGMALRNGNRPEALKQYREAEILYRALGNRDYLAETLATIASIETQNKRLGVAQGAVDDGLSLNSSPDTRALLRFAAAGIAFARGDIVSAEAQYNALLNDPSVASIAGGRSGVLTNRCVAYVNQAAALARRICEEAVAASGQSGARELHATALYNFALVVSGEGKSAEAETIFHRALTVLEQSGGSSTQLAVKIRTALDRLHSGELGQKVAQRDAPESDMETNFRHAVSLFQQRKFKDSERLFQTVLAKARTEKNRLSERAALGNIAFAIANQPERWEEAEKVNDEVLAMAKADGDESHLRRHYLLGGQIIFGGLKTKAFPSPGAFGIKVNVVSSSDPAKDVRERKRAAEYLERGLALSAGKDRQLEAQYLDALADLGDLAKNWRESNRRRREAIALWRSLGDQARLGRSLIAAAVSAGHLGHDDQARTDLTQALDAAIRVGDPGVEHSVWILRGYKAVGDKSYALAHTFYLSALQIALQNRWQGLISDDYSLLSQLASRRGDKVEAARWTSERDEVLRGTTTTALRSARLSYSLGDIAWQVGDIDGSRLYFGRSVALYRSLDQGMTEEAKRAERRLYEAKQATCPTCRPDIPPAVPQSTPAPAMIIAPPPIVH